jgi:BirA family biotin operon repressor/biotin-[acetyl-CoA-carboxylase] ligase
MNQSDLNTIKQKLGLGTVKYLPSTGSTNDIANQMLTQRTPHFSVIVADEQTLGRGRSGRKWYTPPNSAIAVSIILTEGLNPNNILRYSGLGSLAVCETLSKYTTSIVKIKWPNDILINNSKVSGILVETQWEGEKIKGIILGIGINITKSSIPAAGELNFAPTYLENHTTKPVDRTKLLDQLLEKIVFWNRKISRPEFIKIWEENLAYKGQQVQIAYSKTDQIEGQLVGLTSSGEIKLALADGSQKHYNANELKLRPL